MHPQAIATYRIQLTPDFTLHDAAALVPYLARLGISHLYTSPSQQAVPGSQNGYDVIDPGRVNEELGGDAGHDALSRALQRHGMRRMVDIVPNHMAVTSGNAWWNDVLKYGRSSRYADLFDVDWDSSEALWPNRVLLPVLGDQFGRVLEAGEFILKHKAGDFTLHYHDNVFPVEPASTAALLARVATRLDHPMLAFLADTLGCLPRPGAADPSARRYRDQQVQADLLARLCEEEPTMCRAIDMEVERLNNSLPELGEFIDAQNYRLAHWRAADLDLGYRRFFNINTLAGLREELPKVFEAVHALPLQWLAQGEAHALRVDHPDGLRDPTGYLRRLRAAAPDAWIVVEKILEPGEKLCASWPVEGTTGYDFGYMVQGLFVDPAGEQALTQAYQEFTGSDESYNAVLLASKRHALSALLGSDVARLTSMLLNICEKHWRHRDYTRAVFTQVVTEVCIGFDVYRSYVRPGTPASPEDQQQIHAAVARAAAANPELDAELLQFVEQLLLREVRGQAEQEFALRFQQLTGPAMAKGLEDTAFYRYFRLAALNEVGGDPGQWGCSVADFHRWCSDARNEHPHSMLATSTHDSKRSEDVRARLVVLSEIHGAWLQAATRWRQQNARYRGAKLDANTEYLYYQTLVGAWPIDEARMRAYMEKAVRESKTLTEWTRIDEAYEAALHAFIVHTMADGEFMRDVETFVARVLLPGYLNSLAQVCIKLTAPGVPDIYQGCELWDLSLVDPDNRRPVDFAHRARLLDELPQLAPQQILARMDEGLPKLWLIHTLLQLRRERPDLLGSDADYLPLAAEGERAVHVLAFLRGGGAAVIVPRLTAQLLADTRGEGANGNGARLDFGDTHIALPPGIWRSRFEPERTFSDNVALGELLRTVPLALLVKDGEE